MAEETVAGAGEVAEGVVTQVPFAIVVEWKPEATQEQKQAAQAEVKNLMDSITEQAQKDVNSVLPEAVESIKVKRV